MDSLLTFRKRDSGSAWRENLRSPLRSPAPSRRPPERRFAASVLDESLTSSGHAFRDGGFPQRPPFSPSNHQSPINSSHKSPKRATFISNPPYFNRSGGESHSPRVSSFKMGTHEQISASVRANKVTKASNPGGGGLTLSRRAGTPPPQSQSPMPLTPDERRASSSTDFSLASHLALSLRATEAQLKQREEELLPSVPSLLDSSQPPRLPSFNAPSFTSGLVLGLVIAALALTVPNFSFPKEGLLLARDLLMMIFGSLVEASIESKDAALAILSNYSPLPIISTSVASIVEIIGKSTTATLSIISTFKLPTTDWSFPMTSIERIVEFERMNIYYVALIVASSLTAIATRGKKGNSSKLFKASCIGIVVGVVAVLLVTFGGLSYFVWVHAGMSQRVVDLSNLYYRALYSAYYNYYVNGDVEPVVVEVEEDVVMSWGALFKYYVNNDVVEQPVTVVEEEEVDKGNLGYYLLPAIGFVGLVLKGGTLLGLGGG
jgi:hypothetical protein